MAREAPRRPPRRRSEPQADGYEQVWQGMRGPVEQPAGAVADATTQVSKAFGEILNHMRDSAKQGVTYTGLFVGGALALFGPLCQVLPDSIADPLTTAEYVTTMIVALLMIIAGGTAKIMWRVLAVRSLERTTLEGMKMSQQVTERQMESSEQIAEKYQETTHNLLTQVGRSSDDEGQP
jgi:hypothetical protein